MFNSQPPGTGAKIFTAGTPLTTPTPDRMIKDWHKPWLFFRVLLIGLLFAAIASIDTKLIHDVYDGAMGSSAVVLLSVGALIVPLSILIFYWEINIPRDIPIYNVLMILFIGGILSITILFFLGHYTLTQDRAYLAPITEEPAKIIVAAIFIYIFNPRYIFGGLLIGAAVGAGFASFETVGYDFFQAGGFESLILRSVLAIGGHVSWAAIEAGALVMVKGEERLSLKHFLSPQFLMYVAMTMTMHFVWNVKLSPDSAMIAKHALLCAAAVYVSFLLINKAIAQVLQVADAADAAKRLSGNQQHDDQQSNNQKSSDEQNQLDDTTNDEKQSKPKRIAVLTIGLTGEDRKSVV